MASKAGSFFKSFFKVIFTVAALTCGVISLLTMFAPFLQAIVEIPFSEGYAYVAYSGFALAFGGEGMGGFSYADTPDTLDPIGIQAGILVAFILLVIAIFSAITFLVFAWGHKNATVKKALGFISLLTFVVAGVLFLCVIPLCSDFINNFKFSIGNLINIDFTDAFLPGEGAITSGLFGIFGGVAMLVATVLGPKE